MTVTTLKITATLTCGADAARVLCFFCCSDPPAFFRTGQGFHVIGLFLHMSCSQYDTRGCSCVFLFLGLLVIFLLFFGILLVYLLRIHVLSDSSILCITSTHSYTRSPLEDSSLFGPSPWKILRHYL